MQEAHDLVTKVGQLASELGRRPTRAEFVTAYGKVEESLRKLGGYSVVLQMAGYETYHKPKITNEVFRRPVEGVLEEYRPRQVIEQPVWPRILILGDTHFPWVSQRALEEVYKFAAEFRPEHIVQMGDSVDFYAHSRFPRSHNVYTPKEEEALARKGLEEMWARLKGIAPGAKCYQLLGNHCARPLKQVLTSVPTMEHWIEDYFRSFFSFEGVETIYDQRTELEISGIIFTHGFLGREGAHRDFYLKNTVVGHLHKGWIQYRRFHGQTFWELCAGFLGEPESKAMTYNSSKMANYALGFGAIDQYGPRFIHL